MELKTTKNSTTLTFTERKKVYFKFNLKNPSNLLNKILHCKIPK